MRKNGGAAPDAHCKEVGAWHKRLYNSRSVAAARSTRAAASPLQQTAETAAALALRVWPQRFLEGDIQAAAEHSEIIFRPINHAKTQVVSPTEVPRDSEFETGPELAQ